MEILKINGNAICNPSALEWQEANIDGDEGTGRNQQGDMFIDRIGSKRKLSVSFPPMDDESMSKLLNSIENTFFEIEYPDPKLGKRHVITVYITDKTVPVYGFDKDKGMWLWHGITLEMVER